MVAATDTFCMCRAMLVGAGPAGDGPWYRGGISHSRERCFKPNPPFTEGVCACGQEWVPKSTPLLNMSLGVGLWRHESETCYERDPVTDVYHIRAQRNTAERTVAT